MFPVLPLPAVVVFLIVALVLSVRSDPRKLRTGVYLFALLVWLVLTVTGAIIALVEQDVSQTAATVVLLVLMLLALASVLSLAGFLIVTGITLIRREGFAVSRLLGLGVGVGMLGYLLLWVWVLTADASRFAVLLLLLGLPLGYLGFGFASFLLYGALYPAVMARWGGPVVAVLVLGSGLIRGRVPPLLASRLRRGRQLFDRFEAARPMLVTSGGQGHDEPVPEGKAMAEFLVDEGVPADRILVEDRSRNTAQNITYTAQLLREHGMDGPVAVVTNNFHALRAALLMRRIGMLGYSIGSPTARYYWPSAVIREFIAVLRDNLVLNTILLALTTAPLLVFTVSLLLNR